jgi:enterochelin esterase-like enzyme
MLIGASVTLAQQAQPPRLTSPEVLRDGRVVFRLWAPKAAEIALSGDWMGPQPPPPLSKSEDGVWTISVGPLAPNIYTYGFLVDGVRTSDPSCRCTLASADRFASSRFTIPGSPPKVWEPRAVATGTLHSEAYFSKQQQRLRSYVVYTPVGYEKSGSKRYPALLLLPGTPGNESDWTVGGGFAHTVFDNMIAAGKLPPTIVVMHASDVLSSGRRVEHLQAFEPMVVNEFLPDVMKRYRVENKAHRWAIAGVSLGGEFAMTVGLRHPELFNSVASISGSMFETDFADRFGKALADPASVKKDYRLLWIGCGTEDVFAGGNKALASKLQAAGIPVTYHSMPGFHSMPVFRQQLVELLSILFR